MGICGKDWQSRLFLRGRDFIIEVRGIWHSYSYSKCNAYNGKLKVGQRNTIRDVFLFV